MVKRIPNQLKFSFVYSDSSKVEGVYACSDAQWGAIWDVLVSKPVGVLRPSVVPDLKGNYGPQIYFDPLTGDDWPQGCWACGIPECDTYFGATPDAALAAWEEASEQEPKMTRTFTDQMEALFGSDAACGVTFREELENGYGRTFTAAEYDALPDPKPDTESFLPNGGSGVCCTDYACLVYQRLPGRVQIFGFANADNPTSRVARDEIHPGGHDFAIVDNRYIVDPWPRLVKGEPYTKLVFDRWNDADLVLDFYGPRECWRRMGVTESFIQQMVPVPPAELEKL